MSIPSAELQSDTEVTAPNAVPETVAPEADEPPAAAPEPAPAEGPSDGLQDGAFILRNPKRGGFFRTAFRASFALLLLAGIIGTVAGAALYFHFSVGLPEIPPLSAYRPPETTRVYARSGELIGEFSRENRTVVPYDKIPRLLVAAFISGEDQNFFRHGGIDPMAIVRAAIANFKAGRVVQGGSTVTQQVAKTFLSNERSYTRKAREAILSRRLEARFSKEEIIWLYLNQIYLGHGAYGVQAASQAYYGKNVWEITLAEMAILAGLPKAPSDYSPYTNWPTARKRQLYVLQRMEQDGFITAAERKAAEAEKPAILDLPFYFDRRAPYFTEHVRRYIADRYGEDALYDGGLEVHTSLDLRHQRVAQKSVRKRLRQLDKRQGYRGPIAKLRKKDFNDFLAAYQDKKLKDLEAPEVGERYVALVTAVDDESKDVELRIGTKIKGRMHINGMSWARKPNPEVRHDRDRIKEPSAALAVGDVILAIHLTRKKAMRYGPGELWPRKLDKEAKWFVLDQVPSVEGALLSVEPNSGYVTAMVGGFDFARSEFNRAVQACRQPGSSFKPIYYSAAVEDLEYTPSTILQDSPIIYDDPNNENRWRPNNYGANFEGDMVLRNALINSKNVPAIKVLQEVKARNAMQWAQRFGIRSEMKPDLSLALGSNCVTLWDLSHVYATIDNLGVRPRYRFVTEVRDRDGKVLERDLDFRDLSADPLERLGAGRTAVAGQEDRIMEAENAYVMKMLLRDVVQAGTAVAARYLPHPAAGKTGTTNDSFDTWFMGFTQGLVAGAWVGFDELITPLGKSETGGSSALPVWKDFISAALDEVPPKEFSPPRGVVQRRMDPKTGMLARTGDPGAVMAWYKQGTEPKEMAPEKGVAEPENLWKMDVGF